MNIDIIIDMLIDGLTYRKIAESLKIPLSTLHDFVSRPEHFARAQTALNISAQTFDDMAEQILRDAKSDKNEIQRARELAQHFRWRAAKRNPQRFGEKVDVTTKGEKLTTNLFYIPEDFES